MKMIVLAAGRGARMGGEHVIAKSALSVFGRSVLHHVIGAGIRSGLDDFVVIRSRIDVPDIPGVRYVRCEEQRNMLYSLFSADAELEGPLIVSYADIVYEYDVLQRLIDTAGDVCVTVDASFGEYFALRTPAPVEITESLSLRGSLISSIGSPVSRVDDAEAQYIGLLKFSQRGARLLRETYADLQERFHNAPWRTAADIYHAPMTDMLQELIDRGIEITASVIHHGWIELDTPEDYRLVSRLESGEIKWLLRDEALAGRPVVSSGGVVIKAGPHGVEALLVGSGEAGEWRIPKGMVQSGETLEAAAVREVEEETGVRCRIRGHLGTARWPYYFGGLLQEELVHFFLMDAESAAGARDHEHAFVAWHSIEEAEEALLYENERAIVRLASARGGVV